MDRSSTSTTDRTATVPGVVAGGGEPTRSRGASCDIWQLVAPGEPCPTCDDSYEDRLTRARGPRA